MPSVPVSEMIPLVEAAHRANRHPAQLRRAISSGKLKATRVGHLWLLSPVALERYIAALRDDYPRPRRA